MAREEVRGMYAIGAMPMPAGFRYREVFLKGKPQHDRYDPFRLRHPRMDVGKRAKFFAPFDALRGFNFAIMCKNELYVDRLVLSPEDREELDRRLRILRGLTYSGRMARANRVQVTVTYYEPCSDVDSEAYGLQGQYKTVTGICLNVDPEVTKTILVGDACVRQPQASRPQPQTSRLQSQASRPQAACVQGTGAGELRIPMEDIREIEAAGDIFRRNGEDQSAGWEV